MQIGTGDPYIYQSPVCDNFDGSVNRGVGLVMGASQTEIHEYRIRYRSRPSVSCFVYFRYSCFTFKKRYARNCRAKYVFGNATGKLITDPKTLHGQVLVFSRVHSIYTIIVVRSIHRCIMFIYKIRPDKKAE